MFFAVESRRQAMLTTGLVNEFRDWAVGADGKRRPAEAQARDEDTGILRWEVEVLYKRVSYGRESNTTALVNVGSPVRPVVGQFTPVVFVDLEAEVLISKAGGLSERWKADRLADEKPAASNGGAAAAGPKVVAS